MPRGRHRQTSPLNRLLPPIACGVLAVAALVSAPLTSDLVLLRVLVVATAVGAASSAVLLRLRERAAYPDGREATGAEAYAAYGRDSGPVFARLGGSIVWRGRFELMLIGPAEERWDHCFIAQYPSVAAFVEMIRDPIYREAVKHRQAAVEDSRLIRLAPGAEGVGFG